MLFIRKLKGIPLKNLIIMLIYRYLIYRDQILSLFFPFALRMVLKGRRNIS